MYAGCSNKLSKFYFESFQFLEGQQGSTDIYYSLEIIVKNDPFLFFP